MFKRIGTIGVALIAAVASSACGGSPDLFGPGDDASLPENHPAAVDGASSYSKLAWSGNGAELGYVLPDIRTAVARSMGAGARRELYVALSPAQVTEVELSADASEWFTVSVSGVPGAVGTTIRRHGAASTEVITDRGANNLRGRVVLAAANGDLAYVVRPDSLYFRRKAGGAAQLLGVGCSGVAAISPASDGVICYQPDPFGPALRFATATSSQTTITGSEPNTRLVDIAWNSQGIFLLTTAFSHYVFERLGDPQSKFATPKAAYPETTGFGNATLANDGRSFAYGNSYCAQTSGVFFCEKNQALIYHADAVSRTVRRVAIQTSTFGATVSISPDGRRIAYFLDGSIYMIPIS
ncbi:MAG: hypothetical protein ACR2L6_05105 [Gemmatimonadaceae bacterium]